MVALVDVVVMVALVGVLSSSASVEAGAVIASIVDVVVMVALDDVEVMVAFVGVLATLIMSGYETGIEIQQPHSNYDQYFLDT